MEAASEVRANFRQMKIGILGSGYGLYGYAAAANDNDMQVIVKEEYRAKILERDEIKELFNKISFKESNSKVIAASDILVFALPPHLQVEYIFKYDLRGKRIFLEKPLAPNLRERELVLQHLSAQEIEFSVGYLFPFTEWGIDLAFDSSSDGIRDLKINWKIPRPESNWKMNSENGGGIVNYYLIHILKLLVDLNYDRIDLEFDLQENYGRLSSEQFYIELNLTEDKLQNFEVSWAKGEKLKSFQLATPFGEQNVPGSADVRVPFLSTYLASSIDKQHQFDTENRISKLLFKLLPQ